MSERSSQGILSHMSMKAGFVLSLGFLLAAPAWAQSRPGSVPRAPAPPPMPSHPMNMPQMRTPPPMPAPMPHQAPMPQRPAPMPRPTTPPASRHAPPPMRPPTSRPPSPAPVRNAPPVRAGNPTIHTGVPQPGSHTTLSGKPILNTGTGVRSRGTADTSGSGSSSTFMPFNSETARIPAYTHETPNSNFARLNRWKALKEKQLIYTSSDSYSPYNTMPWGGYWGSGYWGNNWGGYWGPSIFFASGLYCDPFSPYWMWGCYSPYSLLMSNSLYAFYPYPFLDMFPSPFYSFSLYGGPYPYYGSSYFGYPFSSSLFFYNAPFSPALFGSSCPLCTTSNSNFSLFALDNPYLLTSSTASNGSAATTAAGAASLTSTYNAPATSGLFGTGSTASGGQSSAFNGKIPASSQPVSLVFADGTTVQATQYWLGNGKLHYVTTAGANESVPISQFDMQATMRANQQNGVRFLPPAPAPKEPTPGNP